MTADLRRKNRWHELQETLFAPVDGTPLVFFRLFFGTLMVWHVARFFTKGWIAQYYVVPRFHFPYPGFEWIQPLPGAAMYWLFALMGVFALGVAIGAWYRVSAIGFFLLFTYVFLIDVTRYVNHYYLMGMAALFLAVAPAAKEFSVDALLKPVNAWTRRVPAWTMLVPAAQLSLVYFYAGIAKLNGDWLRGEPLRTWFAEKSHVPVIGGLVSTSYAPFFFSYGGALFDLLIVPLLLSKRTRKMAFLSALGFHAMNSLIFPEIGLFPWFMIVSTAIFFPLREIIPLPPFWRKDAASPPAASTVASPVRRNFSAALIVLFLMAQIAIPLRRFLYPGNVMWHEYGSRFSWSMKLWEKNVFDARFYAVDAEGKTLGEIDILSFLTVPQAIKMASQPELVVSFARMAKRTIDEKTGERIGVRADIMVSLNGRPPQRLVDPSVDLAAVPESLAPGKWILPLSAEAGGSESNDERR